MAYSITAITNGELTLPWGTATSGYPMLLPLDGTHTLFYGMDTSQGYAVVVEHSDPANMTTAGSYTSVFTAGGFNIPQNIVARLSTDGTTIVLAGERRTFGGVTSGWQSHTLNWTSGSTTLTDQGLQQHTEWSTATGPRPALALVSSSILFVFNGTDYSIFNYSSTGVGSVCHTGTYADINSTFRGGGDIWRVDNTHCAVWSTSFLGPALTVVNVPSSGAASQASSVAFSTLGLPSGWDVWGMTASSPTSWLGMALSGSPAPSKSMYAVNGSWDGSSVSLTSALYHDGADSHSVFGYQRYPLVATVEFLTEYGNQGFIADPAAGYANATTTINGNTVGQSSPHLAYFPLRVMADPTQILAADITLFPDRVFAKAWQVNGITRGGCQIRVVNYR